MNGHSWIPFDGHRKLNFTEFSYVMKYYYSDSFQTLKHRTAILRIKTGDRWIWLGVGVYGRLSYPDDRMTGGAFISD